jgi:predicted CXXCH cytochrome family protein
MTVSRTLLCLLAVLVTASCRDERIVYRDRDLLVDIPAGAQGFVGYSNVQAQMTVCGNCHVSQHNQWRETAHASAFPTTGVPATQTLCAECHGVSQVGNDVTAVGGLPATGDARFHNVQCESCHGPGLDHVRNPDGGTAAQMLARVDAAIAMNGTCTECHSGYHHPYVADEWEASGHGNVIASPAGNPSCSGCHEGKAALQAFGVLAPYAEQGQSGHIAITCAVCHDPHRAEHAGQLRYSIGVPDEQQNLCMRCHHKRGGPDFAAQNRGPHSPEGPMLLGEAGWWPPNMQLPPGATTLTTTHGDGNANPRMCAGCHMQQVQVAGAAPGNLNMTTSSHLFEAIPCLDGQGRPTRANCTIDQRTFRTCTTGCHGNENAARSAMITVRLRLDNWNNQLKSQIAQVPASELNPNDGRYSTAEGARFNSQLADRSGSAVHNAFLMEALLIGSIQQMQRDYGVNPMVSAEELQAALDRVFRMARSGIHTATE